MKKEVVVIESSKDRSKLDLLDAALKEVEFPELIDQERCSRGKCPQYSGQTKSAGT